MPAPIKIRRCSSSSMARARSAALWQHHPVSLLRSGLRVIAPDLPHYGMSGPGNLDKSPARTMQDMREVVYDLVVNQLGVKKAIYLGHSLGGQLVMGYALTWPDAVQSLVLEAPAGLEEYPREITIAQDKKAPCSTSRSPATSQSGSRPGTRPESWRAKSPGRSRTSATSSTSRSAIRLPASSAAARAATSRATAEYASLHTDQRVGLIKGNPKELEQWSNVFIFDIYTMVVGAAAGRSEEPLSSGSPRSRCRSSSPSATRSPSSPARLQRPERPRPRYHHRRS